MLDIKFIREHPEIIRKNLAKRGDKEKLELLDKALTKDISYRKALYKAQELKHKRNIITKKINELKKQGKSISKKIKESKELPDKIKEIDEKIDELKKEIIYCLMRLPNILHSSVPKGKDETENRTIRTFGKKPRFGFKLKDHGSLIEALGLADFDSASKVSGNGFYYLIGEIALLDIALQRFAIDALVKKGYRLIETPLMLRRKPYEGVTDLNDFETMMYKIDNEDLYLIATSEHAIAAMYMNHVFNEDELPKKFVGVSPCFRKEIGSHGIDTKGLFRVHHFNKVEQFIFCKQEDSWKLHEELIKNAEELYKKLKLPYRIVNICTGDIGTVAAKKYDLDIFMPRENKYREVVSCSNCTSYQAVRLNIKYRKSNAKEYAHTLNSTAIATSRTIRAIIENYQQKDGLIKIPAVLIPYMNGMKIIGKK